MNDEKKKKSRIDELIKLTMKDDMPPGLESRFQKHLNEFRLKAKRELTAEERRGKRSSRIIPYVRDSHPFFVFAKSAFAVAALLIVVLGGFLLATRAENGLSESLANIQTGVIVAEQVRSSPVMECTARWEVKQGHFLTYSIRWLSPQLTEVRIRKPEETITKTVRIPQGEKRLIDNLSRFEQKDDRLEQSQDPLLAPIREFLSPDLLAARMDGRWNRTGGTKSGECILEEYLVSKEDEASDSKITLDLCTFLPKSLKTVFPQDFSESHEIRSVLEVHFNWEESAAVDEPVQPGKKERWV